MTKEDEKAKTIGFFSYRGGTGKSTLAANSAIQFAKSGKKTILIDLDFHSPQILYMFNLETNLYLNDYYGIRLLELKRKRGKDADLLDIINASDIKNLDIIVTDPILSLEEDLILHSGKIAKDLFYFMFDFHEKLKSKYDIIIFDSPAQINYHSLHAIILSNFAIGCLIPNNTNVNGMKQFYKLLEERIKDLHKHFYIFFTMISPLKTDERENKLSKLKQEFRDFGIETFFSLEYSSTISYRDQILGEYFFQENDQEFNLIKDFVSKTIKEE